VKLKYHFRLSSTASLFLIFLVIGILSNSLFRHYNGFKARQFVMGSDMEGYYQYLPYVFFEEYDIKQMRWARDYGEDRKLNVFTCGVALLQSPFFLLGHGISTFLEMENRGYNPAYFMSVLFAGLFYAFLGLLYLFRALERMFSRPAARWATLMVFLATNLYYYTAMMPGMSHVYSFFLVSVFIFHVPGFYKRADWKSSLKVILPLGLAVLIRPTNILFGFYFLLYGISSFRELGIRLSFLAGKWKFILLMLVVAFVIFIPQMLYWHAVTGKWVVYSYTESRFSNWKHPQVGTVLIGARNGWFIYTPLMLIASGALFYLAWLKKHSAPAILFILLIMVYLNASWFLPTFSSAVGYRALIEVLPLMSIPLSFTIEKARQKKGGWWTLRVVFVLFVVYNILFSYGYNNDVWWNQDWQWSNMLRLVTF